jgi:outer membrane protein
VLKRALTAAALVILTLGTIQSLPAPAFAMKQKGDFVMRVRAIHVTPDESGTTSAGGSVSIDADTVPELDFTYFFTDNIAAELILATTTHSVDVNGVAPLGDVSLIPPILTLQYHFNPKGKLSPYIGAGINYTIFYDEDAAGGAVTSVDYDNAFGWAAQIGLDYAIDHRWSINLDIKKVWLETDVSVNGGAITASDVEINPWIISVGVGYRF